MFRAADVILLTKSDLLSILDDFKVSTALQNIRNLD